MEFIEQLAKP
jgi:cytochrome-b5 reductase